MHKQHPIADPFALMMHPQTVLDAMAQSERLARLQSRICRPLDKPAVTSKESAVDAFDRTIDSQAEPAQD